MAVNKKKRKNFLRNNEQEKSLCRHYVDNKKMDIKTVGVSMKAFKEAAGDSLRIRTIRYERKG